MSSHLRAKQTKKIVRKTGWNGNNVENENVIVFFFLCCAYSELLIQDIYIYMNEYYIAIYTQHTTHRIIYTIYSLNLNKKSHLFNKNNLYYNVFMYNLFK